VLTQNTAWGNVEKAIARLKEADALSFARIDGLSEADLGMLIRSAGTFRVKTRRLKALATWVMARGGGEIERALVGDKRHELRTELLAIHGIGPETADAILLYAGEHASFVIDAYTHRVLRRHRLADADATYAELQATFEAALPADVPLFNEYHALLVEVGKRHCRAKARCDGCPLADMPHDGSL
jgi:endonuclease-3 related protein